MNRRPGQTRNRRSQPPLYVDIDVRTERRSKSSGENTVTHPGDVTRSSTTSVGPAAPDKGALLRIVKRHAGSTSSGWIVVRHTDGSIAVDRLGHYGDDITVIDRVADITVRYPDSGKGHPAAFVARVLGLDDHRVAASFKRTGWERLDSDGRWTGPAGDGPWILDGADYEAVDTTLGRIGSDAVSGEALDRSPPDEHATSRTVRLDSASRSFDDEAAYSRSRYADLKATYRTRTNEENRNFGEAIMAREDSQRIVSRAGTSNRRGAPRTVSGTREQPSDTRSAASGGDDERPPTPQRRDPAEVEREAFATATGWVVVLRTSGQVIVDRRTSSGNDVTLVDTIRGETRTFLFPGSGSRTGFIARVLGLSRDAINAGLGNAGWSWSSEDDTWTNSRSDGAWTLSGGYLEAVVAVFAGASGATPATDEDDADVSEETEEQLSPLLPVRWLARRHRTGQITLDGHVVPSAASNRDLVLRDDIMLQSKTIQYPGGSTTAFLGRELNLADKEEAAAARAYQGLRNAGWSWRDHEKRELRGWERIGPPNPWTIPREYYDRVNAVFNEAFGAMRQERHGGPPLLHRRASLHALFDDSMNVLHVTVVEPPTWTQSKGNTYTKSYRATNNVAHRVRRLAWGMGPYEWEHGTDMGKPIGRFWPIKFPLGVHRITETLANHKDMGTVVMTDLEVTHRHQVEETDADNTKRWIDSPDGDTITGGGFFIHSGEDELGARTVGCIRMLDNDMQDLKEIVDRVLRTGGSATLEVTRSAAIGLIR